jgi:adenylate cyclase
MAGFTDLSDTIEAAELGDVLNEYFALLSEAVSRRGGTPLDCIGDTVKVVFGAPAVPEPAGDARRAVELAPDIQRQVAAWGESWYWLGLVRAPAVRIGVPSAYATVGTFGKSARTAYAAIGRTTNIAARVQAAARPGGVLVSWATRALAGPGFRDAGRGALQAKGLHAPAEGFEVLPTAAIRVPAEATVTS